MNNKKIYFRFVEDEDLDDFYRWRNDEVTRKFSFNTEEIPFKDHIKWFKASIINPKRTIFMAINEKREKVGQIRFDRDGNGAEIDINIGSDCRGQGYGTKTIIKGCRIYFNNFEVDYFIAKVKKDNLASRRVFEKAGFKKYSEQSNYLEFRLYKNEKS
ncbi:MAG: GNAT family N-acetyltransferase [Nanoarchaeota archaeon]|nr:GNAT family N-acetyltransferase [Nanoarchaeota archaeon]